MTNAALQSVDLLRSDGSPIPGLVPIRADNRVRSLLRLDEVVALNDAASFRAKDGTEIIDYVFFRRFSDGRSSQIAAYVVDNSSECLDEATLARLHWQVWLQGAAPLLYVAWPSRIDVLACARGADFWNRTKADFQYESAATLNLDMLSVAGRIAEEVRRFSAFRLADGTFWENPVNKDMADFAKAAHQSLIQEAVDADNYLEGEKNPILRRLLLLMILIKYLEDRHVFPNGGWFGRWRQGARSFLDLLQGGEPEEVNAFLDFMRRRFNGDVFVPMESDLTREALSRFADFIEGKQLAGQRHLWTLYSFENIPVEVISHLYQRFVESGHGAVYTPPFLASLLLDQVMPYSELTGDERVLDPACGSGIFLVGAFRRLVNIWRKNNDWKKPDFVTLKTILKRSIYGVEWESFAVDLTAFSLSLAICDALEPDVIWNELKFDPLRDANLVQGDFFEKVLEFRNGIAGLLDGGFDVVVGNPPFESNLTEAGHEINKAERDANPERGLAPDKQAAYLFLEQSLGTLRSGGRACLIQPSGFLYNRQPEKYRRSILRKHQVEAVLDFTSIRALYKAADAKTIAVLARKTAPPHDHWIRHWTFRRTVSTHKRVCFELDHYDRHRVSQEHAENDRHVWRVNLLGGGRLHDLSRRFRGMRTLQKLIKEKGWKYSEGFTVGNRAHEAPFLTGRPSLPTKALAPFGIDKNGIVPALPETRFECPREESVFTPPLVVIKELESLPIAFWDHGFLSYPHEIVGIAAPAPARRDLRSVFDLLSQRHRFFRFMITLGSSRSFIAKSTSILKRDIDSLPFPEDSHLLDMSFWEEVLQDDALDCTASYIRLGQDSDLLQKSANTPVLQQYSDLFVRMLGSVYTNLAAAEPVFLDGLTCQPFYFGDEPDLTWLSKEREEAAEQLRKLIYEEDKHACLRTVRVLRFYTDNVLLIVKPDRLRYWIRSTAIRDADETLIDLRAQGY